MAIFIEAAIFPYQFPIRLFILTCDFLLPQSLAIRVRGLSSSFFISQAISLWNIDLCRQNSASSNTKRSLSWCELFKSLFKRLFILWPKIETIILAQLKKKWMHLGFFSRFLHLTSLIDMFHCILIVPTRYHQVKIILFSICNFGLQFLASPRQIWPSFKNFHNSVFNRKIFMYFSTNSGFIFRPWIPNWFSVPPLIICLSFLSYFPRPFVTPSPFPLFFFSIIFPCVKLQSPLFPSHFDPILF